MITINEEAKNDLLTYFNDTKTVYTILRYVSSSGMTRHISLVIPELDIYGNLILSNITYHVAELLGYKASERNGFNTIKISGCGMDMGFKLVYDLSSVLFSDQDRAGYVLNHRWL